MSIKQNFNVALILIARGKDVYGFVWCEFSALWWWLCLFLSSLHMGLLSDFAGELGLASTWSSYFSRTHRACLQLCRKASVFCSHHGASSVSAACPRGAREVISENPSQLLELTQRTHSTAEIPAGLGQAQQCCQENDSVSADTVLVEGGLWRIAYKKSKKLSKQYLCRRRKGKGNVSFAWIQSPLCPSFGGICAAATLSIISLLDRVVSKIWQVVLVVAGV